MRIIPALDIIGGKCVRLTRGDYTTRKSYYDQPLEVAKMFQDNGLHYLHLVDLDGARSKHIVHHRLLHEIASKTTLQIDFGGGIRSDEDLRIAFECGAKQVTGGSIAVQHPNRFLQWLHDYGSDVLILGADSRNGKIATQGWQHESEEEILDFITRYQESGIRYVICTDIARDGMLQGPSTELYRKILRRTPVQLIASGGITTLDDLLLLRQIGCEGAIVGKAIYEGRIGIKDLALQFGKS